MTNATSNDSVKFVVAINSNGLKFAVLQIGDCYVMSVQYLSVKRASYRSIDVISCESEEEARKCAWDYASNAPRASVEMWLQMGRIAEKNL